MYRSSLDVLCQSLFDKLDLATLQAIRSELSDKEIKAFPAYERRIIGNAIAELDGMVVTRLAKSHRMEASDREGGAGPQRS